MKKVLLAATMLSALASGAKAEILGGLNWDATGATILQLEATVPTGNQVKNLPCIICGANQPQQPTGFGYNLFGNTGNADTVAFFSTSVVPQGPGSGLALDQYGGDSTGYAIGDGSIFKAALRGSLGIQRRHRRERHQRAADVGVVLVPELHGQDECLAVYSPGPGGTLLPAINDGTGYPDWTLTGFSLAGITAGDVVGFYARITGANDGPDSFFIIPLAQVPGPAVGAGLPALMAGVLGFVRVQPLAASPLCGLT